MQTLNATGHIFLNPSTAGVICVLSNLVELFSLATRVLLLVMYFSKFMHCFIYFVLFPFPPLFPLKSIILTDDVDDDGGVTAFLVTQPNRASLGYWNVMN